MAKASGGMRSAGPDGEGGKARPKARGKFRLDRFLSSPTRDFGAQRIGMALHHALGIVGIGSVVRFMIKQRSKRCDALMQKIGGSFASRLAGKDNLIGVKMGVGGGEGGDGFFGLRGESVTLSHPLVELKARNGKAVGDEIGIDVKITFKVGIGVGD